MKCENIALKSRYIDFAMFHLILQRRNRFNTSLALCLQPPEIDAFTGPFTGWEVQWFAMELLNG